MIRELFPPITRRVIYAALVMAVGAITNAWHANVVSGIAIVIPLIALSVWLGLHLDRDEQKRPPHPEDSQ